MAEAVNERRSIGRTLSNLLIPGALTLSAMRDLREDKEAKARDYLGSEDFIAEATIAGAMIVDAIKLGVYATAAIAVYYC